MDWNVRVTGEVTLIRVRKLRGERFSMENRPSHGLAFVSSGRYRYTRQGKSRVSDGLWCIFLPRGTSYGLECLEEDLSLVVNFQGEGFPGELTLLRVGNREELFREAGRIAAASDELERLSLLYGILSRLSRWERETALPSALAPALALAESALSDPALNRERLAEAAHMSPAWLCRLFIREKGLPPMTYLRGLRMARGKELLLSGAKVEAAAEACGYSSAASFCTAFRKQEGTTPGEFLRDKGRI